MGKRRKKVKEVPEEELVDEELPEADDLEDVDDEDEFIDQLEGDDDEESSDEETVRGDGDDDEALATEDEQPEVEVPVAPDDSFSVEQLTKAGCRLDINDKGNVWRLFFYDKHTNAQLNHTLGLPGLKELWVIGSKVTKTAVEELKKELPNTKIYS